MITRRNLFKAGAATGLGLAGTTALASCSGRGNPGGNRVNLWGLWASDLEQQDEIVAGFMKDEPDAVIKASQVPSSGEGDASSIITAVRGGTAPDIWLLDRFAAPQYASIGLLEPLDGLIEEYEGMSVEDFTSQYLGFSIAELSYDGHLYGLPFQTDSRLMIYNKGALDEKGIDYSALLDPDTTGAPTWDEVWDIHDQFTEQDAKGNYTKVGFIPWDGQGHFITWALGNGAKLYDENSCQMSLRSDEMKQTAEEYAGWIERLKFHRIDAFKATYEPPSHPPAQTSFLGGQQAMQVIEPSSISAIHDYAPDIEWGVTYLPVHNKGDQPFTWAGGHGLCAPRGSSMSKMTWDLMKYYCGDPGQLVYMPQKARIPTFKKTLDNPKGIDPELTLFAKSMDFATCRPPLPVGQNLWDALVALSQSLQQGSETPEQACETAQNRVDPQMQQFCPFKLPESYEMV